MHRNTYIVITILAIVAALVVGVNIGTRYPVPAQQIQSATQSGQHAPIQSYTNVRCGFTFMYPSLYELLEEATVGALLRDNTNNDTIIVACQKEIPRPPLIDERIEAVFIQSQSDKASTSAILFHDTSQKDGLPIDSLIFTHKTTGFDIYISGFGQGFNELIKTVKTL